MGLLYEIGLWRHARPIAREAVIATSEERQTIVWSLDGVDEVGVIEKVRDGKFLNFTVVDKPFGRVVGTLKRARTLRLRKGDGNANST